METIISGARALFAWRVALALLSRQVIHLNLIGWIIEPFAYLGLFFYYWVYPSPQPPKHEAQRCEVVMIMVMLSRDDRGGK